MYTLYMYSHTHTHTHTHTHIQVYKQELIHDSITQNVFLFEQRDRYIMRPPPPSLAAAGKK